MEHHAETIGDIIAYLASTAFPGSGPVWPPDAFAVAATILKRSGAYREVANAWPPKEFEDTNDWHEAICGIADEWRDACDAGGEITFPDKIKTWWDVVLQNRTLPLEHVVQDRNLLNALVGIVAASDSACRGFGFKDSPSGQTPKIDRANANLSAYKSLCEIVHASRCTVLPKAHNPVTGMTLRSLTHNLALWDRPEVAAMWENIRLDIPEREMNLLLVPWPLIVDPAAFHEAVDCHELRLPGRVGLFEYDIPFTDDDVQKVASLVSRSEQIVGKVHGIVFPELAMSPQQFDKIRSEVQEKLGIPLLISGIGCGNADRLGTNNVAISIHSELTTPYLQGKHHRWRLDAKQATDYGIATLAPKPDNGAWWESIHIENRSCIFFNANDWLTFCVLICEDLARQDPVSELVRSVGPSLLVALLLDGPQISNRWPGKYATILADDPRSSVLTLTCAGLVDLSNKQWGGKDPMRSVALRSVALWKDAVSPARSILLGNGSAGVVLRLESRMVKEWTADGRHDDGQTGYLALTEEVQIPDV